LGRADADDVFARGRRADGFGGGAVVAGGEDNDHFLVAWSGVGRAFRLGVAHEGVVFLRIQIVWGALNTAIAPTVIADAGTISKCLRHQVAVGRTGEIGGIKNDGRTQQRKRADAQSIVITRRILEGEPAPVIVSADDVGVDVAVAVAAGEGAEGIGSAFKAIVNHAAGIGGVPERVEAEMIGMRSAVIDTAVRYVNDKGIELGLVESVALQPGQVARSAWSFA
jgi:hypothetical protein